MLRYKVLHKLIIVACALSLLTACSASDNENFLFYIAGGHTKQFFKLLDNGVDINARTKVGYTPLIVAAKNNQDLMLAVLLRRGADVNAANKFGWTALIFVAKAGYVDCLKTLLENGAEVNRKNSDGWTPLMWAAAHGHVKIVKLLLDNGANIDEKDKNGKTAFSHAEANGYNNIIAVFIRKGAALISGGDVIGSMLLSKVKHGKVLIPTELPEKKRRRLSKVRMAEDAFMTYASNGSISDITTMLTNGMRVDIRNDLGETPLMLAIKNDQFLAAEFLIKKGANVSVRNIDNFSVLDIAKLYTSGNSEKTIKYVGLLKRAGAKK